MAVISTRIVDMQYQPTDPGNPAAGGSVDIEFDLPQGGTLTINIETGENFEQFKGEIVEKAMPEDTTNLVYGILAAALIGQPAGTELSQAMFDGITNRGITLDWAGPDILRVTT